MPLNHSGSQLAEAFTDAVDSVISKTGTVPATDQEILDVQNAVIEKLYAINPTGKPTPTIKF